MMNNVSIYGVQGVDPMGIQDGMLAMLFEEGAAGFSEAMDSALLSTESFESTESAEGDATLTNGFALLQSEMAGVMPGLQIRAEAVTPIQDEATPTLTTTTATLTNSSEAMDFSGQQPALDSDGALEQLLKPEGSADADVQLTETLGDMESLVVETQQQVATSPTAPVNNQGQAAIAHASKMTTRTKGVTQVEAAAKPEEINGEREVSMEARDVKPIEASDELIEEWDSSHLQLDAEFDHVAANSPFTKPLQSAVMDNRAAAQADTIEAADNDGVQENAKTDDKKIAERSIEAQVEPEEFEENPADARVELSDQRTVRVVVDEDLSVEVSQDGKAVDVLVEGAQDVTQDIREAAPEIADSLDEAGYQLRDFTTRDDGGQESKSTAGQNAESRGESEEADAVNTVNRGQSVNVVA